jgi:cell division septum initiation protein DivIVA
VVRRGFDQAQVLSYFTSLNNTIRELVNEKESLVRKVDELTEELRNPTLDIDRMTDAFGRQASEILRSAHDAATAIRQRAEAAAKEVSSRAQREAEEIESRAQLAAESQLSDAAGMAREVVEGARSQAQEILQMAERGAASIVDRAKAEGRAIILRARESRAKIFEETQLKIAEMELEIERLRSAKDVLVKLVKSAGALIGEAGDLLEVPEETDVLAPTPDVDQVEVVPSGGSSEDEHHSPEAGDLDEWSQASVRPVTQGDVAEQPLPRDIDDEDSLDNEPPSPISSPTLDPDETDTGLPSIESATSSWLADAEDTTSSIPQVPHEARMTSTTSTEDASNERDERDAVEQANAWGFDERNLEPSAPALTGTGDSAIQTSEIGQGGRSDDVDDEPLLSELEEEARQGIREDFDERLDRLDHLFGRLKSQREQKRHEAEEILRGAAPEVNEAAEDDLPQMDETAEVTLSEPVVPETPRREQQVLAALTSALGPSSRSALQTKRDIEVLADEAPLAARSDVETLRVEGDSGSEVARYEHLLRRRDSALAPVELTLTRRLKRILQDDQSAILDALRQGGVDLAYQSAADLVATSTRNVSTVVSSLVDAVRAGIEFGRSFVTDEDYQDDLSPSDLAHATSHAESLSRALDELSVGRVVDMRDSLERSDESTQIALIGSVFREVRGTKVDELVGDYLNACFASGVRAVEGATGHRWITFDIGGNCADCDDNALAGDNPPAEAFPTGHRTPPVHAGCRCLIVPVFA